MRKKGKSTLLDFFSWRLAVVLYALGAVVFSVVGFLESAVFDIAFLTGGYIIANYAISVFAAPIAEESMKRWIYMKTTVRSGFLFGVYFTVMEMLLWMTRLGFWIDWSQFVRLVFPFHALNYFVQKRFNFNLIGLGIAIGFHAVNNLFAVLAEFSYGNIFWYDLGYSLNFVALATVAGVYLQKHLSELING